MTGQVSAKAGSVSPLGLLKAFDHRIAPYKRSIRWSSFWLAAVLYIPTVWWIWRHQFEQSFATWILWVALDAIALGSIRKDKGDNYQMLIGFIAGGTVVSASLALNGQHGWGGFESLILALVIGCLGIWAIFGNKAATVATSLAVFIATVPQMVKSWQEPERNTALIYTGFVVVNALGFIGGDTWTVKDRFYPATCITLCAIVAVFAWR